MAWLWYRRILASALPTIFLFIVTILVFDVLFHAHEQYGKTMFSDSSRYQRAKYIESNFKTVIKTKGYHQYHMKDPNSIGFSSRNVLSRDTKRGSIWAEYETTDTALEMHPAEAQCDVAYFNTHFESVADLQYISGCQRIIYNRVPKCGSRTVITALKKLAKQNDFELIGREKPNPKSNYFTDESQKISLLNEFAHFEPPYVYTQHLHFLNVSSSASGPVAFVNVIREPTERLISHYYYKIYGSPGDRHNLSQPIMTLKECMKHKTSICRRIHELLPFFCEQSERCRKDEVYALATAKQNFQKHVLIVGFTEDLHGFMEVAEFVLPHLFRGASETYNIIDQTSKQRTKTAKKPEVDEKTKMLIRNMLFYEYEFYNFARQKFYSPLSKVRQLKSTLPDSTRTVPGEDDLIIDVTAVL